MSSLFIIPRDGGIFGFTDFNSPNGGDILDVQAAPFLTYDLVSPIGPLVGSFADFSSLNNPWATSAGDLILTAVGNDVIVTASSVPEPSSATLLVAARRARNDRRRSPEKATGRLILAAPRVPDSGR